MYLKPGALLIASLAALALATPAAAQDFTGPFVGAAAGYSRDEVGPDLADGAQLPTEEARDAAYFQLFAGYDLALSSQARFGVEAAFGLGAEDRLRSAGTAGSTTVDPEYTFEATGRLGYLVNDSTLLFVRGGYQNARVETTITPTGQPATRDKADADGWLVGGGGEYALTDTVRARLEYRYSDLGANGANWDRHQVLAGVLWNF